jgi:hypothetical protein
VKALGLRHPFFLPLWRRVVTVVLVLGWAIVEFVSAAPLWGVLFGAIGLVAAWEFFVAFDPVNYRGDER